MGILEAAQTNVVARQIGRGRNFSLRPANLVSTCGASFGTIDCAGNIANYPKNARLVQV
jgi:hypothetical protein